MKKLLKIFFNNYEASCQHLSTKLAGALASSTNTKVKNFLISYFIKRFVTNMSEAEISNPFAYPSFNALFTRQLKAGARPIADGIVSPVDGTISALGKITDGKIFQAKGKHYSLAGLLANQDLVKKYKNGSFITIYLAPTDYHRIHMPTAGKLDSMCYIPGRLHSVRAEKIATITNIFTINERLVCNFNSLDIGSFSVVNVGAQLVSGLETVWHGAIKERAQKTWHYSNKELAKADELGRFNFGSTVILCFGEEIKLNDSLIAGSKIMLGSNIAQIIS